VKEFNMRTHAGAATVVAALWAIGPVGAAAQASDGAGRPVVAILDFTNSALVDHEVYEPFTVGIAGLLLSDMRRNPEIELVERERLYQVLEEISLAESGHVDEATAVRAGRILGAHHLILGVFFIDRAGTLRLDARAVNVESSRIEHVETVADDADNLLRAVNRLGRQLSTSLELPGREVPPPNPGAASRGQLLANLLYSRALMEEDLHNPGAAVDLYCEFLAQSPADYAAHLRAEAYGRIEALTGGQPSCSEPNFEPSSVPRSSATVLGSPGASDGDRPLTPNAGSDPESSLAPPALPDGM
jgi:hypothetical protein